MNLEIFHELPGLKNFFENLLEILLERSFESTYVRVVNAFFYFFFSAKFFIRDTSSFTDTAMLYV